VNTPLVSTTPVPEGRIFHTLDALRGIAAIGVLMFHMRGEFLPLAAPGGYLAVDLFFLMSGVVLSNAYEARFRAGMGTLAFMRVRLIRLYPLYLLGTLFGIAVVLASMLGNNSQHWDSSSLLQAALLALLFLPSISTGPVNQLFPLNIPCWSLFLELVVNLLFVAFWPLLTSRRLVVVSLLTGTVVGVATFHHGNIDQGWVAVQFPVGLARTLFGFSVGILIARHFRHAQCRQSNLGVLAIIAIFGVAIAGWPHGGWRVIWDAVCVLAVFPLMVCGATMVDPGVRLRRAATFLGVTSYAVYVLQNPLVSVVNSVTRHFSDATGGGLGAPWLGIAVLVVLLTGCWLVDLLYDMPIRRLLSRIIPKANAR
jgi:peptidoglycan/LPS O-acetylase OafA/YrhL